MIQAVQGHYRTGRIELDETPGGIESARVVVLFLPDAPSASGQDQDAARDRMLAQLAEGLNLGGPPYPGREELHDRRL
jgi:hypothetical protein